MDTCLLLVMHFVMRVSDLRSQSGLLEEEDQKKSRRRTKEMFVYFTVNSFIYLFGSSCHPDILCKLI